MRLTVDNNSNANTAQRLLTNFEHYDVNLSASTKRDCFKFLMVIVKNLLHYPNEPKYQQLKHLSNAKIQRFTSYIPIRQFLELVLGFVEQQQQQEGGTDNTNEPVLKVVQPPPTENLETALRLVTAAYERVDALVGDATAVVPANTARSASSKTFRHSTSSGSLKENNKMSAKQKAKLLQEEKLAKEKEMAKHARKRTVEQIKNDKHVRKHDANWKPNVSAAAAKSGDTMSTFRDKFGE